MHHCRARHALEPRSQVIVVCLTAKKDLNEENNVPAYFYVDDHRVSSCADEGCSLQKKHTDEKRNRRKVTMLQPIQIRLAMNLASRFGNRKGGPWS